LPNAAKRPNNTSVILWTSSRPNSGMIWADECTPNTGTPIAGQIRPMRSSDSMPMATVRSMTKNGPKRDDQSNFVERSRPNGGPKWRRSSTRIKTVASMPKNEKSCERGSWNKDSHRPKTDEMTVADEIAGDLAEDDPAARRPVVARLGPADRPPDRPPDHPPDHPPATLDRLKSGTIVPEAWHL
jgi:hypothetical protein